MSRKRIEALMWLRDELLKAEERTTLRNAFLLAILNAPTWLDAYVDCKKVWEHVHHDAALRRLAS